MPRHNCSVLQRLCKKIELNTTTQTLIWHGRWRPAREATARTTSNIASYPYPEFHYDAKTALSVQRFLYFNIYYPLTTTIPQEAIVLIYHDPPAKNELSVSDYLDGRDVADKRIVPLKGKLQAMPVHRRRELKRERQQRNPGHLRVTAPPQEPIFRPIPIQFPQITDPQQRVALIMHYLHGGTDADAPLTVRKSKPAKVTQRKPPKGR